MSVGKRLKHFRLEKGFSQNDIATFLNISRQSVSRWETGKAYPDIDKLVELSKYYGISIDELLKEPHDLKEEEQKSLHKPSKIEKIDNRQELITYIDSWGLLLLTVLSITVAPFGLLLIPFILWRNKKDNQFYKLTVLFSVLIFLYNIHVFIVWLTTIIEFGVTTTIISKLIFQIPLNRSV
ncbi:helix-turn-helix domain-containing protein [Enterococcus durans]|uniref:helix-turn-helix domain-containing protein n=1 Tax=Enterococcus durans TaxID=53345 RepID=UPI00188465B9|nr:helix-turn-helix domain-containing protein [Enterococcus durans]MBE9886363.1 helix-turn-helix domain-containing protein [Enterococcus durans]